MTFQLDFESLVEFWQVGGMGSAFWVKERAGATAQRYVRACMPTYTLLANNRSLGGGELRVGGGKLMADDMGKVAEVGGWFLSGRVKGLGLCF